MFWLGSGDSGEFTFMDYIAIVSLLIGIENLDLNITQEDMDKQTATVNNEVDKALDMIQTHLEIQDKKIDELLKRTETLK